MSETATTNVISFKDWLEIAATDANNMTDVINDIVTCNPSLQTLTNFIGEYCESKPDKRKEIIIEELEILHWDWVLANLKLLSNDIEIAIQNIEKWVLKTETIRLPDHLIEKQKKAIILKKGHVSALKNIGAILQELHVDEKLVLNRT